MASFIHWSKERLLSISIYKKVIGIGVLFTVCFGSATLYVVHWSLGDLSPEVVEQYQLSSILDRVFWTLISCAILGLSLTVFLTQQLTKPIKHLVSVTRCINKGDLKIRAKIFSQDEIGELSKAFNEMIHDLEAFKKAISTKENDRQLLIEKIVFTQEQERKMIALELHDDLGQSLLALLMTVQSLPTDSPIGSTIRKDLINQVSELVSQVRILAWGMRPSILDDYGLDFALAQQVKDTSERFKLEIFYKSNIPESADRMADRVEITLFRIGQEAIHNIVRHSKAKTAHVILSYNSQKASLLIIDDGIGFDYHSLKNDDRGLGLIGMKERANLINGTFRINSNSQNGTTIGVEIPLG